MVSPDSELPAIGSICLFLGRIGCDSEGPEGCDNCIDGYLIILISCTTILTMNQLTDSIIGRQRLGMTNNHFHRTQAELL
jgi:hypothetical protein